MLATANDVTTSMAPFPFELAFKFEGLAFKTAPVFNIQGLNFMILEPSLILPSNARSVSRLTGKIPVSIGNSLRDAQEQFALKEN